MQMGKMIQKEIILTIVSIVLISILLISFSYAYFLQIDEGEQNVVEFGNLSLTLCKTEDCNTSNDQIGNIIGLTTVGNARIPEKFYPISDELALTQEPYRFIITNNGDYDLYVKMYLKPDETFDATEIYIDTDFKDFKETDYSNIKLAINEKGNTPTIKTYISLENSVLAENILLNKGESKIFELIAWESINAKNSSIGTYFVTRLSLEGEYIIDGQ